VRVVRDQVTRCLTQRRPASLESLDEAVSTLNYTRWRDLVRGERLASEQEHLQTESIRRVRDHLRPPIVDLVRQNRRNALKQKYIFPKPFKGKAVTKNLQYWCWQLDMNDKFLLFADCDQTTGETIGPLNKVPIAHIRRLITGVEYTELPQLKAGKKSLNSRFGFCLEVGDASSTQYEYFNLLANEAQVLATWMDGLGTHNETNHCRLSELGEAQVQRLLDLELKLRLMDVEPGDPPIVPKPPRDVAWIVG